MRIRVIACDVLRREIYWCAARAPHAVDVTLLAQGLHDNSDLCRGQLQPLVDETDPAEYGAIVLGYGLCNNALAGVRAGRVPLVIPRAHDCITLLLGSKERYARLFAEHPGTYWFSRGWLECHEQEGPGASGFEPMQKSGLGPDRRADYADLVAKYGEDNARYLAEFFDGWKQHYTRAALIEFDGDRDERLADKVRAICLERGWEFARVRGDLALLEAGFAGRWDAERFLVLAPGERVRACYDERILEAESAAAPAATACTERHP
ncbi:MAG: DUF1638 domain-containing protein [Phycisphaerae bacterium]|nr:DUF1638 domain-containing protein [Phycisphaerae bacterium]